MLKSGAEVDKTDRQGLTSLALAVQEGHVGPMRMLLAHGADVDRCNENGTVPLFLAAGAGDEAAVLVLLEHGASVDLRKKETGATPLHAAVRGGSVDVVKVLLAKGANPNFVDYDKETPLVAAVRGGVKEGPASPVKPGNPKRRSNFPEHLRDALVGILLAAGARPDERADAGDTALTAAARRGSTRLARRLLEAGADATLRDGFGNPPLFLCASLRGPAGAPHLGPQQDLAELLLAHGAQVDGADARGATALHAAVYYGRLGLARLFLAHGARAASCLFRGQVLSFASRLSGSFSSFYVWFPRPV